MSEFAQPKKSYILRKKKTKNWFPNRKDGKEGQIRKLELIYTLFYMEKR